MLNFDHHLPEVQLVKDRHPFIVNRCTGKTVLHIGCVDAGLLEERFASGELLHKKLNDTAALLFGIDIDVDGLNTLRSYGYSNLFAFDLTADETPAALQDQKFDIIILSEILEHLPNPGRMLERLKDFMEPGQSQLIISVPNAFSVSNVLNMTRNVEHVHPDHNYYFSFVKLNNTLKKSGFNIAERFVYIFDTETLPNKILNRIFAFDGTQPRKLQSPGLTRRLYWRYRRNGAKKLLIDIPNMFLSATLLRRSSWWGDGLIAVCIL